MDRAKSNAIFIARDTRFAAPHEAMRTV